MSSSSSSYSRPGSVAKLDMDIAHRCHICLKQFSRRDLRERHRRRCEKSIGKIIPTKKRSCERCISFKVKCGYEKPSCNRCLDRSVPCEYKLEPKIKMPLNPAFGLGLNAAFTGSMDVFSVQESRGLDMDGLDAYSSSVTPPENMFGMSSSGTLADWALDATLDLVGQGLYGNEYYQHWGQGGTTWADGMMLDGSMDQTSQ